MEKHEIAHESVSAGIGENVARRSEEKDLGPLAVESRLDPYAVYSLDFIDEKFDHVLESVRLNPQMVSRLVAIGRRPDDPVDVAADKVQEFPAR